MKTVWRSTLALAFVAISAHAAAPAFAQAIQARVERPTDLTDGRLYVPFVAFFTASTDEALLTLSRPSGDCSSFEFCTLDSQCVTGVCHQGSCRYPTSVEVGYVAVVTRDRFCASQACGPNLPPPECAGIACNGESCADNFSNANRLCQCSLCTDTDPILTPAEAPFAETFVSNPTLPRWVFVQAAPTQASDRNYLDLLKPHYPDMTTGPDSPAIAMGQIHLFGLQPGTMYALVVKWSPRPYPASTACPVNSGLTINLAPTVSMCAP